MDVDRNSLGMRIHRIRKEKGLTLEEFGQLIDNASKSVVSKWERGITMPNNKRIKIIADISQISVFELLYGSATAYVYDNINSLLPDKLIVNRGVISMESIQYLGKR